MRLKDGFITHEGAEEHITVPAGGYPLAAW